MPHTVVEYLYLLYMGYFNNKNSNLENKHIKRVSEATPTDLKPCLMRYQTF